MKPSSENNSFTALDIERYHSGNMSASERHALEKAALDDPFLADALEGYSFSANVGDDLHRLRQRLNEKSGNKKPAVVVSWKRNWLRVAALVTVLAGAGWMAYKAFSPQNSELAVQNDKKAAADKTNTPQDETIILQSDSSGSGNSNYLFPETAATGTAASDLKNETKGINQQLNGRVPGIVVTTENHMNQDNSASDTTKFNSTSPMVASSESLNNRSDREQLMNRNNRAAFEPAANNGNYRPNETDKYKSKDAAVMNRLQQDTSAAPRISGYIDVNKSDTIRNLDVVLKKSNDPPPEEFIFDKDSTRAATAIQKRPFVVIDTLEPAEGYSRFDDYIANNLKMPEELKVKPVAGVVELLFDVNNEGNPVNITVVKSLCHTCDEEAIRLLKEGPKWKKKKNQKGKISIRFN